MPARKKKLRKRKSLANSYTLQARLMPWFLLVFLVVLFLAVGKIFKMWRQQLWIPETRFSIVVAADNPTIYSYNPNTGNIIKIRIPANTQIATAFGYGHWPAGSLWDLGKEKGKGGEILRLSIQKTFGLPIDGWFGKRMQDFFQSKLPSIVKAGFYAFRIGKESNLTFFDRIRFLFTLASVGSANIEELDLAKAGVIQKSTLPDGVLGFIPIPSRARRVFERLRDDKILAEGQTIIVVNGTSRDGLASEVGDILSTLGLRVIQLITSSEDIENCLLLGNKEALNSTGAKKIIRLFKCDTKQEKPSRPSQLELIIGTNYP